MGELCLSVRFVPFRELPPWWAWLNGATAADQVQALLRPCPEAALAAYPVSTAVGNVRNDAPALIQPV